MISLNEIYLASYFLNFRENLCNIFFRTCPKNETNFRRFVSQILHKYFNFFLSKFTRTIADGLWPTSKKYFLSWRLFGKIEQSNNSILHNCLAWSPFSISFYVTLIPLSQNFKASKLFLTIKLFYNSKSAPSNLLSTRKTSHYFCMIAYSIPV